MASSKRGPKTAVGKKQSAKNSTTHGLRSEQLTTSQQVTDQDNFLQELVSHYQPVGPLERMQLERIATCRVKLKCLYDLELAKMNLLIQNNRGNLKKNISEVFNGSPLERGMLYELLRFKRLMLPMDLNVDLVKKIVQEVDQCTTDISSDDDLRECLPTLVEYLNIVDANTSELHVRLIAVSDKLHRVVDQGDSYSVIGRLLVDKILSKSKKEKELTPEQVAHAKAIDDHIERANERRRAEYGIKIKKKVEIEFPPPRKISEALAVFKTLLDAYESCLLNVSSIQERIKIKESTLSLPIEEADLLMRYQTSWERRLSTLIGEFMQLQKMRIMNEPATQKLSEKSK